jgi:hypothetical protein
MSIELPPEVEQQLAEAAEAVRALAGPPSARSLEDAIEDAENTIGRLRLLGE